MSSFRCRPDTLRRIGATMLATTLVLSVLVAPAHAATPEKKARRPRVLVLGDSVFSMLLVADDALEDLNAIIPVIYRGEPCQKLLTRGCVPGVKLSALQQFRTARGKFTDAVVVATGYNEGGLDVLRESLAEFRREAKRQDVRLIWATYRIAGNVKEKATRFNRELRRAERRNVVFDIFDWNRLSRNRPSWFSGDKVHLSRGGTVNLARRLGRYLKRTLATKESATTQG